MVVKGVNSNYHRSMDSNQSQTNWAVALLIINKVEKLPSLAIKSIRNVCDAPIFIGYTRIADVHSLSGIPNLHLVDLSSYLAEIELGDSSGYLDYNNQDFYQLVQLKWHLFEELLSIHIPTCNFLVYSDFDVIWNENPEDFLRNIFLNNNEVEICVQDASAKIAKRSLCMGFIAFRNSNEALSIISSAKELHRSTLLENPRSGDDWVISQLYSESNLKNQFWLLPQLSFPVGLMANTFLDRSIFSGLVPPKPFIFHSNYLVGSERKALMMIHMLRVFGMENHISMKDFLKLICRKALVPIKRLLVN